MSDRNLDTACTTWMWYNRRYNRRHIAA